MGETMKVGVIGAGSIGISHMNSYQESPQAELVAIADIDGKRAGEAGEKFGISNVFTDYEEMLEVSDLEAVSVCLPNALHAPASIAGLRAGKHVLCEKPLTVDVKSALEMLETSRITGKRLAMSLNLRHGGKARMLKAAADSGELGEIYHGKGGMLRNNAIPRGWFHRKKFSGGGPLLDLAPHILDVTWWMMGRPEPVAVSGATYAKFGPRGLGMGSWGVGWEEGSFDVEDFALGMVRFRGGETLFAEVSWALNQRSGKYSYVCGTEGGASLLPELDAFRTDGTPIEMDEMVDENPPARFISDLLADRPALGPVEDGVVVMKMLEGIYRSAELGEEVRIR